MTAPTPRVRRRIEADFGERADAVVDAVAAAGSTERLQAAIVLAARARPDHLEAALRLAALDWRDLLVDAGLEHADWPARLDAELGPS
ncbi:hypothetical protein [Nocardioides sp. CFH 31398]|uniref:hypothetical protein n=1 Tax=Nocardioides sp. CFH 31398 TaxID=2919579 RepID=UPI001F055106|nr:hypothetical protein [Nocardioides sp. CFH 31398]MCH1867330.1 hypothetical protein [Nocardioides sp. CFH 31398]